MDVQTLGAEIVDVDVSNFLTVVKATECRRFTGVVLHHSMLPERPIWGVDYARALNQFHFDACGWNYGLGYQFVVSWNVVDPKQVRIQASYRWVHQLIGAHTQDRKGSGKSSAGPPNETMIGICFVGNYDAFTLPPETYLALKPFVEMLLAKLNIPRQNVYGAYAFEQTTSPGRKFDTAFFRR